MHKHVILLLCFTFFIGACSDPSVDALRQEIKELKAAQNKDSTELSGVVKHNVTNTPLEGVRVQISDITVLTNQDGVYRFPALPLGEVKLLVKKEGFMDLDQTLNLEATTKVHDMDLTPDPSAPPVIDASNLPSVAPTPLPSPIVLLPDGSTPTPLPSGASPTATPDARASASPSANNSASPAPSASATPEPTPTPTPLYDPELDNVHRIHALLSKKGNGLELNFVLQDENANPISWGHGKVKVEYYISESKSTESGSQQGTPLSSGITQINQSNDPFVVSMSPSQLALIQNEVYLAITLTLPDDRQLRRTDFFDVF